MKPLTRGEKAERVEAQRASARQAMADYHGEEDRIEANRARLKALRLEREGEVAAGCELSAATKKSAPRRDRKI